MSARKEIIINKLARDKIPEILARQGIQCQTSQLDSSYYESALNLKLLEESTEYQRAKGHQQKMEELADILEVIYAILAQHGIDFAALEKIRKAKLKERGGFQMRIFLEKTFLNEPLQAIQEKCLFCRMAEKDNESIILARYKHCYVIADKFPVSEGHVLIIPEKHTENWFTASEEVRRDIMEAIDTMKTRLDSQHNPDGYNIGMNCGTYAGQSIMHLHVHLIPRYKGDMQDPKGGVRGVIPSKQHY